MYFWCYWSLLLLLPVVTKCIRSYKGDDAENADGYKTICYFTNWGAHRSIQDGRLFPEDIPADLCTHILYAFGVINGASISHTIQNDISVYQGQEPLYGRIMKLKEKNPNLKILISCGGWGANGQFEGIVGSEEARVRFSNNVIEFCRKWNFDGIDLDWEFPGAHHKTNFGLLAQTMYKEFEKESQKTGKPRLLSAIATAAGQYLLKQGYDIPVLCKWLDMVNIMTYDLYGSWYNKIGHHSSLYHAPGETGQDRELNTNSSVYNWLEGGCLRHKLNIGIPTYGRAFSGSGGDPLKIWGMSGGGSGGLSSEYVGEAGIQTYFEICMRLNKGYKRYWDPVHYAAIAYDKQGGTWIGYDDPGSVEEKCKYVKKERLSGAMVWTLDMDDFGGKFCKNGTFPVIRALSDCLRGKNNGQQTKTTTPVITASISGTVSVDSTSEKDFELFILSNRAKTNNTYHTSALILMKIFTIFFIILP